MTGENVFRELDQFLSELTIDPAGIFILVDENTRHHCLPILLSRSGILKKADIIDTPSGEKSKSIEFAIQLWDSLLSRHANRHSLLINLGGGVISDIGGFVASTFQRGIPYMNIPTTLLAQVDASIGGKTAINFREIKNQVGTFYHPQAVFIHTGFLKTLPEDHIANGFAEVIKYALIEDIILWENIKKLHMKELLLKMPADDLSWDEIVERSVKIKYDIVERDFHEDDSRKLLNFGHTFGHALEAFSGTENKKALHHGHAVAMGIIFESWLSFKRTGLSEKDLTLIVSLILANFDHYPIDEAGSGRLIELMSHDKKNRDQKLCFTLLERPGKAITDQQCSVELIYEALNYYQQFTYSKD